MTTLDVREFLPQIRAVAGAYVRPALTVGLEYEDLLAEAMLGVLKAIPRFDPARGEAGAFLWRTAQCAVLDALSRQRNSGRRYDPRSTQQRGVDALTAERYDETYLGQNAGAVAVAVEDDPVVDTEDMRRGVHELVATLDTLTEPQREALQHALAGEPMRTLAARRGVTIQAVSLGYRRGLAKLRAAMEARGYEPREFSRKKLKPELVSTD